MAIGFHARGAAEMLDIAECHVLRPEIVALLPALRALLKRLSALAREGSAVVNLLDSGPDLLLRTDLDERQRSYAEGVHGAGESLLVLINDILDFSKVEAGRLELEDVDLDLVSVVEGSAEIVAGAAHGKGLELLTVCDPDLPARVRGDPGRLRQVLINLVDNSIKYGKAGGTVTASMYNTDGNNILIEVSDDGLGIPEAHLPRIFERFYRTESGRSRDVTGSGLGLAICKHIIEAHDHSIHVRSKEGVGTTIGFTLSAQKRGAPVATATT